MFIKSHVYFENNTGQVYTNQTQKETQNSIYVYIKQSSYFKHY